MFPSGTPSPPHPPNLLDDAVSAKGRLFPGEAEVFVPGAFGLVEDRLQEPSNVFVGAIGEDLVVLFVAVRGVRVHDVVPLNAAWGAKSAVVVLRGDWGLEGVVGR